MYKKSVDLSLESVLVEIDENKKLMPSRNATVQPVALMRLGLFLPSLKRKGKDTENISIDASNELQSLELQEPKVIQTSVLPAHDFRWRLTSRCGLASFSRFRNMA
jgi:hypothetical protein